MKTAFFCSSLEPGRDGVGDYTRRLAGEWIRQGYQTMAVALNDSHITETVLEAQEIEGASIPVMRLPSVAPWSNRTKEARIELGAFNPHWISLQFVPFGYHPKGLSFGVGKRLADLNINASWHIMFHELWLGLGENSSVKDRIWGAMQRLIILDMVRRLRPRIAHTHAEPYRIALKRANIPASILPLFSNVPYVEHDGWVDLLEPLLRKAIGRRPNRKQIYLAGVFGGVPPEWKAQEAVNILFPLAQSCQKRIVLVFLGKNNLPAESIDQLKLTLQNRADIITVGERSSIEISQILQSLDLGLATTPIQVIQKSGAFAAMLEHGMPVLAIRDDWRLRGTNLQPDETFPRLFSPSQFALLKTLPTRDLQQSGGSSVKHVAGRMLSAMKLPLTVKVSGMA
jgi:hypothetical protein